MDILYALGLILGLNVYIGLGIYLSKQKQVFWGLLLPFLMSGVSVWRVIEYVRCGSYYLNSEVGVSMICSFILAVFGWVLFTVVRYGESNE